MAKNDQTIFDLVSYKEIKISIPIVFSHKSEQYSENEIYVSLR